MDVVDVLLISMPFCDEYMPCMTYALFKSLLAEAGIKSRVQHEYLYYAARTGKQKYRQIMQICTIGYGHDYYACEAVFADAAHGRTMRSFDEYLDWMRNAHIPGKVFAGDQKNDTYEGLTLLKEAHDTAPDYIDEAAARVMASRPKIVAFTSMFQQHNAVIALAKRLKKEKDPPFILVGGPNCHRDAGQALITEVPQIDYCFTGEADHIFAGFCKRLLNGGITDDELPPGVLSRNKTTAVAAEITTDLDSLPVPDFSDYYRERAMLFPELNEKYVITVEGSRGCWWAVKHPCRFCGLNGCASHLYREKSAERFADELTELSEKYPNAQCFLTDNVLSLKHMKELPDELLKREAYRKNMLRLFCEIKSSVSEEEIVRLTKAGFYWVQAGIESFSDRILKLMNKGVTAIRQVQTMKHCRAHNVAVMWYVLVGTPGETEEMCEEVNEVLPKIMHLDPPGTVAHVMYLRHSDYMENPGDDVPALRPDRGYDYVYPNESFIRKTAHLFAPADEDELRKYYDYRRIGPAYERLYDLTEIWRSEPCVLFMKDKGDVIKIMDTRMIADQLFSHFDGVDADVLRLCRNVRNEEGLIHDLMGKYSEKETRDSLVRLTDQSLLLKIGGEYLTLAVDRDAKRIREHTDE